MGIIVEFTVPGQLPSMKNNRQIVRHPRTGQAFIIKSKEARDYAQHFDSCVRPECRLGYCGPAHLRVDVYYRSRRSDLDIEYVKDLLQKTGVIGNDRQIASLDARKGLDPENPRIYVSLSNDIREAGTDL